MINTIETKQVLHFDHLSGMQETIAFLNYYGNLKVILRTKIWYFRTELNSTEA